MTIFEQLRELGCAVDPCGSRVTCRPAPMNTDEDWLVDIHWSFWSKAAAVRSVLVDHGFRKEGKTYEGQGQAFESWRKGEVNLIVTPDAEFARKHRLATHVCKKLNLLNKEDRVLVFQAILYGARR